MSFLYPAFLIGALAIALPIVLHLLRRDVAPEVPFTAVRLLRRSPVERERHRRLRDILLLVARVVALLLLAAAFARPYLRGAAPAPVRIVALDRSYSMGGPGRFDRARSLAKPPVYVLGCGQAITHASISSMPDLTVTGAHQSGDAAYRMARMRETDIDVVALYDAFTINTILFLEDL